MAVCLRFITKWKARKAGIHEDVKEENASDSASTSVNVDEMQRAETFILKCVQQEAFAKEIASLARMDHTHQENGTKSKDTVDVKSPIYTLDPFLDENGIIRVGGRIRHAKIAYKVSHPVLLPQRSHVSDLLITHYHIESYHSGRGITLNNLRQAGYWILGARNVAALHIKNCVQCRKLRGSSCGQKMADLPSDRLENVAPFTSSAVDYFGPFIVKEGRKELKRWGVIFVCMASRAIHLEVSHTLNTDSFLNAYRRFVCRRGPIRLLRSDRGTNFIGGRNELRIALEEMDFAKISAELLKDNCDLVQFAMNVPYASHMNGAWERMIRSVRNVLCALLQRNGQQLDDELLHTFLTEAEAVVNSRPLTYVETSLDTREPISPSQLLTLKCKVVLPPPGQFVREDLYCRRRWRRVQYMADQFWSRWRSEFLHMLQERKKWNKPRPNLVPDDIVLLMDDSLRRNQWPLERVVEVFPSKDGLTRKVKIRVGDSTFDRPIHKLVLVHGDRGSPVKEPEVGY